MRNLLATALLLLGSVAPVGAQTTPMRRVEFDEAVRQAVANSPTVASAALAVARADALLQQVRALTRPTLTAGVSSTTLDSERGFSGGVTQPQTQVAFTANASMPIAPVARWAQADQARDQIEISTLSSAESRQQIAVAAAQAYLTVIASRRQVEVDTRALENARAHLDYATRRLEGGVGSRLNQLRAAQEEAADAARLEVTLLALRRAQESLGVVLAEAGPVDAGAEPTFAIPPTITEEEWMAARPDLRVRSATIRSAERIIRDTWKVWIPTAGVSFDPQYITPSGLFQPSRGWRLTFSASQRLFDAGVRAERALVQVNLGQAQHTRTAVEIQARSEVRFAQASAESRQRALESTQLSAQRANEVLQITTQVFEVGAATNIEVIDAQRSARDAETQTALAEDALRRARLDLLVALGRFPQ